MIIENRTRAYVMQKSSSHEFGGWLFPLIFFAAILQNFYDLTQIFEGGALALYSYEGPLVFKLGKDLVYILLFISILSLAHKLRKIPLNNYSLTLFVLIVGLCLMSTFTNGPLIGILGLRWALPLLLFLVLRDWVFFLNTKSAARWIGIGLVVCLSMQVYQIFKMPPIFGEILPGIPARTPGIFIAPNSAAFFACASAACLMVFVPYNLSIRVVAVVLAVLISLLAQSGTGMVVSFILLLRVFTGKSSVLFWVFTVVVAVFVMPNLNVLTMREDYLALSGGGRIEVFFSIVKNSWLSMTNFGLFTNAANLQSQRPDQQIASDSLMASWFGNFGATSVLAVLLMGLFVRYRMKQVDWNLALPCVIVFVLFSFTTIVFEAFPMNIYLAVGIWAARGTPNHSKNFRY